MSKTVRIPRRSRAGILAAIILGICLLLLLTVGVLTVGAADAHPPRLVDNAGLLSQAEADSLRATLDQYSEELNFDIVVVTTNTLDGKTPRDYADDYFDYTATGTVRTGTVLCSCATSTDPARKCGSPQAGRA